MTALARERTSDIERWTHRQFTLASGNKAWKQGIAFGDPTTGKVVVGGAGAGRVMLGYFDKNTDATTGDKECVVDLGMEIEIRWRENDGSITAANVFALCYVVDDQTVGLVATGRTLAGRIWAVEAGRGVAFQVLRPTA